MYIVGLTGNIATGKSTVSNRLKEKYQLKIVDADKIARKVMEPGQGAYKKTVRYFKDKIPGLVQEDGQLDRGALRRYVFEHPDELKVLNGITHPAVRWAMFWQVVCAYVTLRSIVILDVPLLFESGLDAYCTSVITVLCSPEVQLRRIRERNPDWTEDEAKNVMKSQVKPHLSSRYTGKIIDNSSTIEHLNDQIDTVLREVRPSMQEYWYHLIPPVFIAFVLSYVLITKTIAFFYSDPLEE
jgi:dephospho-CoA kinase